jgi:hypothetical protein
MVEPDGLTFEFNPLYQQDQKTLIETRKLQADIDNIYMTNGVYDSFEVAANRFGKGEFSYETSLEMDSESREESPEVDDGTEET